MGESVCVCVCVCGVCVCVCVCVCPGEGVWAGQEGTVFCCDIICTADLFIQCVRSSSYY